MLLFFSVFNAVVRLCMRDLLPCLLRLLNLTKPTKGSDNGTGSSHNKLASSGSNWKKLKSPIKCYLTDLLTVINIYLLIYIY